MTGKRNKMFGQHSVTKKVIELPEPKPFKDLLLPLPRPTPILVPISPSLRDWETLAKEIGFFPAKYIEEKLLQVISQNGMRIFDYDQVYLYLKEKALKQHPNMRWLWRPLREKDRDKKFTIDHPKSHIIHSWGWHGQYDWGRCSPYDKAVPLRVLKEVKLIENEVPTAHFFVSDYAIVRPDPFIMVTQRDVARIVFDVWDEPDFGIGKEE
jgi:hypothetical protein